MNPWSLSSGRMLKGCLSNEDYCRKNDGGPDCPKGVSKVTVWSPFFCLKVLSANLTFLLSDINKKHRLTNILYQALA